MLALLKPSLVTITQVFTKAFFPSCISEHFHRELWAFLTSHRQVLTIGILALALYSAHTALIFSFFYSTRLVIQRRVLRLQIDDLRADLEGLYYRKEVYTYYSRLLHRQFMAVLGSIWLQRLHSTWRQYFTALDSDTLQHLTATLHITNPSGFPQTRCSVGRSVVSQASGEQSAALPTFSFVVPSLSGRCECVALL